MVSTPIWIAIVIGVFFVGIGVSYAHFANMYDPMSMKFQNQELFNQMMSNNPKMSQQWIDSDMMNRQQMMNDPQFRQQMFQHMMQNHDDMMEWMAKDPQHVEQMSKIMKEDHMFMSKMMSTMMNDSDLRLQMMGHMSENPEAFKEMMNMMGSNMTEHMGSGMNQQMMHP